MDWCCFLFKRGCVSRPIGLYRWRNEPRGILLEYYNQWKYEHPNADEFVRIAERVSGMVLDWYKEYWVNSTKTIDYKIESLWMDEAGTSVRLARIGAMPMPIEVALTFKDSTTETHYVPLNLMYGQKPKEGEFVFLGHPY